MIENKSSAPYQIWIGDRIAQLIILPMYQESPTLTNTQSIRNTNGFGSTGV